MPTSRQAAACAAGLFIGEVDCIDLLCGFLFVSFSEDRFMSSANRATPSIEQLSERITPTTAIFSNGMLFVQGDNQGNNISVLADNNGQIHVTERGQEVTIAGATQATTANVSLVVELAGKGNNNTLSTAASLGSIPDTLIGNGGGIMTFKPLNNAPSNAFGSSNPNAFNDFISNPGGKDVFVGGAGRNLFDWEPGTGTDTYIGAGKSNTVLVVGNNNGKAENDSLTADGSGGVTYSRNNLVPFKIYTKGIENWYLRPSTGAGNNVTINDLTGTPTKKVEVDASSSTVDASQQNNANVTLVVRGVHNTVSEGAGPTQLIEKVGNNPSLLPAA
jgi:hypothetical protein